MNQYSDVPLIDFDPFVHGSPRDREHIASAIDSALSSVGFIYLSNHGIDQSKVDECFNWSKRFFELPESEKRIAQHSPEQSHHRGYSAMGDEKVRERISLSESFNSGNPEDEAQPNPWPSEELLPGFRKFMEAFFQDCTVLVHQLLDCLSLALDLSSTDSLAKHHTKSLFNLSLIHYPALPRLLRPDTHTRIPAHSDFGTITLLFQDDVGGLEIAEPNSAPTSTSVALEKSGAFRHVEPKPGTVVVNVGYLLMRWSNGRWKNTVHRVVEPPPGWKEHTADKYDFPPSDVMSGGAPARYSIPFFAAPDPETIVEALAGCWSEEMPKRWKPICAGDYLRRKMERMYA